MNQVYCEVLYSLLHAVKRTGCDNSSIDQVFDYLKKSFKFSDAKHDELLSTVRQRSLVVLKARHLKNKDDVNDLIDWTWISINYRQMKPNSLDVNEEMLQPLEIWECDPDEATPIEMEEQLTLHENFDHYEQLLRIVVEHELGADVEWRGVLPYPAAVMLRQFATHRGLRPSVTDACCWSVYSTAMHNRTLDIFLMLNLVQRICKAINDGKLPDEKLVDVFWTAADSFVTAALSAIRYLRNNTELSTKPEQLSALLECLKELNSFGSNRPGLSDLQARISESLTMGATDYFSQIMGRKMLLKNSICICQSLVADLRTILTTYHEIFERIWHIPTFTIVYLYYDGQLTDTLKPLVDNLTKTLNYVHPYNNQVAYLALEASGEVLHNGHAQQNEVLFELYLCLQRFHKLSASLPTPDRKNIRLAPFYTWFETAVDRWLDNTLYKAMIRIGKAVQLDNLQTVDSMVKHSSSAVDAVSVFYSIKMFWEQLSWPDEKGALSFVIKITDVVKQSATIYAEAIRLKLEKLHSGCHTTDQPFFISLKICSGINSVLHVQQSIKPLAEEIGLYRLMSDDSVDGVTQETENAIKEVNEKLDEIFDAIARRFEVEVATLINNVMESDFGVRQTDDLNSYIGDQLLALDTHLDRNVFIRVFNIIHHHILQSFLNVVEGEIHNKRQPACFRQWKELLDIIENCFDNPYAEKGDEIVTEVRRLLRFNGMDTDDLIHQYRLDRLKQTVESNKEVGLGSLSVRVIFIDDVLNIDILNGRHLKATNAINCSANPYIKVQLLPTQHFPDAAPRKSKVHKGTLFPLFEESVTYPVPKYLQTNPECYILFTVKDKDLLIGANEMMGEYFLGFQQITRGDSSVDMNALKQMILPLTRPTEKESEFLNALEGRAWDKKAKDFAKTEKKRMTNKNRLVLLWQRAGKFKKENKFLKAVNLLNY